MIKVVAISIIFFAVLACTNKADESTTASGNPLLKGDRLLGVHLTDPENGFNIGFSNAKRVGFDAVNMHFFWGVGAFVGTLPGTPLETNTSSGCSSGSTYDMNYVSIAHSFYPSENKTVTLTIGTYDGPNKFVPACASAMSFNSSTVKTMFKYLLDNIFATINAIPQLSLASLVIGNEIDLHSELTSCAASPSLSTNWANYKEFFDEVAAYAKTYRPGLKVGFTVTHAGSLDLIKKPCISALLENADFLSLTYYPINFDFTVKDPSSVSSDFKNVTEAYPGKVIYFQEVGYPSGSISVGSNETKQNQFYKNIFSAWDTYSSSVKYVSFVNTHEWSSSTVDGFGVLYGICPGSYCTSFKEFLQTLGVRSRTGDGADKSAFQSIIEESRARGW